MVMQTLIVAMNGREVGQLFRSKNGTLSFQYQATWLNNSGARAISRSLPLRSQAYEDSNVFNFFQNLRIII